MPNDQIPSAPRAPVFARHSSQTPYGYAPAPSQNVWQNNDISMSAPPPPHSLAPVAMGSERGNYATTGSHSVSAPMASGSDKPSLKWGVMIALTGALLGGVLGLGMDARRQAARAAAAAENAPAIVAANQLSGPVAAGAAAPPQPVVAAPIPAAPIAAVPVVVAPTAAPAPQVQAPVIVAPPAVVATKHAAKTRTFHPTGGSIAVKVNKPAPEPKEKPEPVAKASAPEKDPPASTKAAPKKDVSAAQQVLEAANKDTVNTL